eukprot:CAMPEP_0197897212 /NCGR_PEP_ID=MMETSP1439-20131203/42006_1 /TAXON_ID=66791 /ORGANISM="Gonyaulax spinifera, Strain CCMP409" /LENGTH=254 /DNA_ID=CAMNT_0043517831 /DNA_START=81 /DNA_END=841 /DNA_ORIENTATION=+
MRGSARVDDVVMPRAVEQVHGSEASACSSTSILEQVLSSLVALRAVEVDDAHGNPEVRGKRRNLQVVGLGVHRINLLRAECRDGRVRGEERLVVVLVDLQLRGGEYPRPAHEVAVALLQDLLQGGGGGTLRGETLQARHELIVEVLYSNLLVARLHAGLKGILRLRGEGLLPLLAADELLEDAEKVGAVEAVAVRACPAEPRKPLLEAFHFGQEPRVRRVLRLEGLERHLRAHQRHRLRFFSHLALVGEDLGVP